MSRPATPPLRTGDLLPGWPGERVTAITPFSSGGRWLIATDMGRLREVDTYCGEVRVGDPVDPSAIGPGAAGRLIDQGVTWSRLRGPEPRPWYY